MSAYFCFILEDGKGAVESGDSEEEVWVRLVLEGYVMEFNEADGGGYSDWDIFAGFWFFCGDVLPNCLFLHIDSQYIIKRVDLITISLWNK